MLNDDLVWLLNWYNEIVMGIGNMIMGFKLEQLTIPVGISKFA